MTNRRQKRDQAGFLLIDFIFALLVSVGFAGIVFVISYGFSLVEVAQYMAFSTARTYLGGHLSEDAQRQAGMTKYEILAGDPIFGRVASGNFIEVVEPPILRNHADTYGYQEVAEGDSSRFVGARMQIQVNLFAQSLPLLGSAGEPEAFRAFITAFPGREPSVEECSNFGEERLQRIISLDPRFNVVRPDQYANFQDNGC